MKLYRFRINGHYSRAYADDEITRNYLRGSDQDTVTFVELFELEKLLKEHGLESLISKINQSKKMRGI